MALTGKTIGELTLLETITPNTLFPVELDGDTYHAAYSSFTSNGGGVIEATYSELVSGITGETLNTGSYYIITDFRTCYDQPDFNSYGNEIIGGNYKQSAIEPIIVLATSSNTISTTAYQPSYPKDRIQYDWTFSETERTQGAAYGRISERIDEFNNRTDYDHRTILFKRYQYIEIDFDSPYQGTVYVTPTTGSTMDVTGIETFFTGLTIGQYVGFKLGGDFRVYEVTSISGNTLMTITGLTNVNTGCCIEMFPANGQTNTSYLQNNITTAYTEYYTFDYNNFNVNNYIGNYANSYFYDENSFILANNVFQGSTYRNNTFGDMCYNNSFDDDCENNTIGNYFYNNITDDDFDGNVIGNYFYNNRITSNFQYNRIGENFRNNYIVQNSFYRNNIMNGFEDNIISGNDFQNNEIGSGFNNNVIRYGQFYKNDIGNGFNYNKVYWGANGNLIGNGFNGNNIYCGFYDNVIGEYFYDNTLGNILNPSSREFYENRISTRFESNTITDNFYKNEIGPNFYSNDISGVTYTNRIGEQFENNTIYGDFYDNQIFNEFKGNITYQYFYGNRLDWGFGSNQFSGSCVGNTFGPNIDSNDFFGIVFGNTFKGNVFGNTIGDNFATNNIGFGFISNIIGENFGYGASEPQGNIIGNNFADNTIGEYFYNNSISDNFHDNTIGNYFQWNIINTNIDNTDFTLNYGNITGFSFTATGTTAGDGLYTNMSGPTNGSGVYALFNIEVFSGEVVGVSATTLNRGQLYQVGDIITIPGGNISGTDPEDNIVITVTGATPPSLFYEHYTKQIFERKGGNKRVLYYDEEDILNIDSIYTSSGYVPIYSQSLTFPISYASFNFHCDGVFSDNGDTTNQTVNNTTELVALFNQNFINYGYFFDNYDGTIGIYIRPYNKLNNCPNGTYTLYVYND